MTWSTLRGVRVLVACDFMCVACVCVYPCLGMFKNILEQAQKFVCVCSLLRACA